VTKIGYMTNKLTVVMPVYNEAGVIEKVVTSFHNEIIKKYPNSEFIIIEDGSIDGTKDVLLHIKKKIPIKLFMGKKKKGYFNAAKYGLSLAKGDIVFFSDSDLSHDPKDFWKMFEKLKDKDLILGSKIRRKDSFYRIFISKVYNILIWLFFNVYYKDINAGFKLMKKEVVEEIAPKVKHMRYGFWAELVIRSVYSKKSVEEVFVSHFERSYGKSHFKAIHIPKAAVKEFIGFIKLKSDLRCRLH